MARLAVATSPAVLFVGPPGTGKNRLLGEILEEIRVDPEAYGFSRAYPVEIEPAEEGWTTRDLVGGETIEEGSSRLRFRPGRVLDAIANNRWLVIDEANRADLDRIFGGLLTWLSGQDVVVGRVSTKVESPLVRLRWGTEAGSQVMNMERLEAEDVGTEPIDFIAGTEFRLLGTYNALDAQRVFRFGLALGRRFSQVPIPPAAPDAFRALLVAQAAAIVDDIARQHVVTAVDALYRAHLATPGAALGPAMFLTLPEYVQKGLQLGDLSNLAKEEDPVSSLIAEGYLLATGSWLARLDPSTEIPALEARLTSTWIDRDGAQVPAPMSAGQWHWIMSQLPIIGG
ncbi:hypothetical protein GCM10010166_11530 [Couchioplanes caeruleus subsp. azureus]|nr:hypothetical protein GCM10010166_11530 [Couchioplanes caeruleus subsp. azureus]